MKSHSLDLNYKNGVLPIQILELNKSFFVYVGTPDYRFDNLVMSIPFSKEESFSTVLFDDLDSENAKKISNRLSIKTALPVFVSLNIPDNFFTLEFGLVLETSLTKYLIKLCKS